MTAERDEGKRSVVTSNINKIRKVAFNDLSGFILGIKSDILHHVSRKARIGAGMLCTR